MDDQLIDLFHRHAGTAFDRRLRLAEFRDQKAPGEKWAHDPAAATLALGKLTFEAPVLGTRRDDNNWLWAWSDRNARLTVTNRALGDTVRALAHRLAVHQLAAPALVLEPLLGTALSEHAPEVLGGILAAELGYDAVYLADKGRTAVLVRGEKLKANEKYPLHRVRTVFPKLLKALPVPDPRRALVNYARDYGLTAAEELGLVRITGDKGGELVARFGDRGTLVGLEATNIPEPKPAAKPVGGPTKKPAAKPAKKTAKAAAKATKKPTGAAEKKPAGKKPTKPAGRR